jgi:NitT/TauT family transport system ATP-binding protein
MYVNGAGFMLRAISVHSRPFRERNRRNYLSRSQASQKPGMGISRQTAPKSGATLLNFLSGCANIVRATASRICHYSAMAVPNQSISAIIEPPTNPRQSLGMSRPASVRSIDVMSTEPAAKRLVVDAKAISLTFETADGRVDALSNVDLQVAEGEFVSFIGPSGCGKTTMLRVIADLQQPTSGTLSVNGMTAENARLARSYGYVFQAPALFPWRTIEKNIKLPLEIMGFSESEQQIRAERYLSMVNLMGFERKFPWQLSGGMQQRVSIARALSFDPAMLLMDEPFGALDEIVRDHLNEQLLQLWKSTEKTVLFVTHSIPEAVFLSTKIVVMSPRPGRIIDIIDCDFPADRSLEIRETPEFLKIAQRVRNGLRAGHSYDE